MTCAECKGRGWDHTELCDVEGCWGNHERCRACDGWGDTEAVEPLMHQCGEHPAFLECAGCRPALAHGVLAAHLDAMHRIPKVA